MTLISRRSPRLRIVSRLQTVRNRRDALRSLDRKGDDLFVGGITADQRDVGPVQGRHRPRSLHAEVAAKDLVGQVRRRGMRDRVVRVDDVERPPVRETHDRVRERQQILRLSKERIRRGVDALKGQAGDT